VGATLTRALREGYDNLADAAVPVLLYSSLRSSGMKYAETRASQILADIETNLQK